MKAKMVLVLASSLILLTVVFVSAEVPSTMSYQGRLTDDSGQPVPDSSYSFVFAIYDTAAAGTALWSEGQTVSTQDGLFTVELGSVDPLPETVFQSSPRYLGIAVNGDPEQTPRNRLTTAPFAFQAAIATATGGQGPATDWICPFYHSKRFGSDIEAFTRVSFLNPNDQGSFITLTFFSVNGVQLDQCTYFADPHSMAFWWSDSPSACADAAPVSGDIYGWFSVHSDLPIALWGFYVSNSSVPGEPVFGVPLGFYVP